MASPLYFLYISGLPGARSPAYRCHYTLPRIDRRLHTGFNRRNALMPPPYKPSDLTTAHGPSSPPSCGCTFIQPRQWYICPGPPLSTRPLQDQGRKEDHHVDDTRQPTDLSHHMPVAAPSDSHASGASVQDPLIPPGLFQDQGRKEEQARKSYRHNHQEFPPGTLVASRVTRRPTGSPAQARSRDVHC